MAYFTEELPDNKYYIFGRDGGKKLAEKGNVPFIGEIPLVQGIREGGDIGYPSYNARRYCRRRNIKSSKWCSFTKNCHQKCGASRNEKSRIKSLSDVR